MLNWGLFHCVLFVRWWMSFIYWLSTHDDCRCNRCTYWVVWDTGFNYCLSQLFRWSEVCLRFSSQSIIILFFSGTCSTRKMLIESCYPFGSWKYYWKPKYIIDNIWLSIMVLHSFNCLSTRMARGKFHSIRFLCNICQFDMFWKSRQHIRQIPIYWCFYCIQIYKALLSLMKYCHIFEYFTFLMMLEYCI